MKRIPEAGEEVLVPAGVEVRDGKKWWHTPRAYRVVVDHVSVMWEHAGEHTASVSWVSRKGFVHCAALIDLEEPPSPLELLAEAGKR